MGTAGFVILHYGDRETTDACVRSVLKMKDQERIRIIIVDNDIEKTEDERRKLKEAYRDNSRITVLKVRSGGGFSQANNLGYRFAREKLKASFIIVLNNDIEFTQEDFVGRMERSFRENPCHVLGPDVVRAGTGEHQNPLDTRIRTAEEAAYTVRMNRMALRLYPVAWPVILRKLKKEEEKLRQKKAGEGFYREVQKDIVPFGACLIFTPEFVKREELAFDPETQFFYEEYILAYRCRKKGYHTVFDPSLKVLHESGAATAKTFRSEKKRLKFMLERTAEAAQIYHTMITGGRFMFNRKEKIDWQFLVQFSIDDFRNKYAGSLMGVTWAFIQPLMTIVIYWFIFQVGFHSQPVENYPFVLWLVAGIIPWFFISEAVTGVTPSLAEYSYLVKKVLFNIDILPLTRIVSCFLVQIFLAVFTVIFFACFGYYPDVYYLQLPYYMLYMMVLLTGIGYCTAALYPFFRDLLQIVNIVMQVIFWLTPIVWNFNIMSETIRRILVLNPFYYVVAGYRDAFVYKAFFWENWKMGIYYWAVALIFLLAGRKVFRKMKMHFADVL